MNAPHPLLHRRTGAPVDDAMRHDDDRQADQALHEAMLAEAEQQAPLIVLAQLQIKRPGEWFEPSICTGALSSPDEIFSDAVEQDDDSRDAYAELMASPAAQRLRQAMAEWFGRKHAMAIYLERAAGV